VFLAGLGYNYFPNRRPRVLGSCRQVALHPVLYTTHGHRGLGQCLVASIAGILPVVCAPESCKVLWALGNLSQCTFLALSCIRPLPRMVRVSPAASIAGISPYLNRSSCGAKPSHLGCLCHKYRQTPFDRREAQAPFRTATIKGVCQSVIAVQYYASTNGLRPVLTPPMNMLFSHSDTPNHESGSDSADPCRCIRYLSRTLILERT
jgi:hypothetical protein